MLAGKSAQAPFRHGAGALLTGRELSDTRARVLCMECTIPQAGVAAIAVSLERDVRGAKRPNIEVDNSRPVRGRVAAANVRAEVTVEAWRVRPAPDDDMFGRCRPYVPCRSGSPRARG